MLVEALLHCNIRFYMEKNRNSIFTIADSETFGLTVARGFWQAIVRSD